MFSSAALRLAVDFVDSLEPPPAVARPNEKAAGIVDDQTPLLRDALKLTPLMKEVRSPLLHYYFT